MNGNKKNPWIVVSFNSFGLYNSESETGGTCAIPPTKIKKCCWYACLLSTPVPIHPNMCCVITENSSMIESSILLNLLTCNTNNSTSSNPSVWTNKAFFPDQASYRKEQTVGIIRNGKLKLITTFFFTVSRAIFCLSFKNSGFAVIWVFLIFPSVAFFKFSNQNDIPLIPFKQHPFLALSTYLLNFSLLRFTGV